MPPSVGDFQGSPQRGSVSADWAEQGGGHRRMREASFARARARVEDTVVVRVDRDDFVHFQHGHPVH